jgi:hypothetical protein
VKWNSYSGASLCDFRTREIGLAGEEMALLWICQSRIMNDKTRDIHSFGRVDLLRRLWCGRSHGESLVCVMCEYREKKLYVARKSDEAEGTGK